MQPFRALFDDLDRMPPLPEPKFAVWHVTARRNGSDADRTILNAVLSDSAALAMVAELQATGLYADVSAQEYA